MAEIFMFAVIGILLLIPLALFVGGLGLIVGAMYSIRDSLKGKK
jgi:hypothetical protein